MSSMPAQLAWDARCTLGEGCVWDAARQRLLFVDIKQPAVLAWTPATGRQQRWAMPDKIGWLVPRESGGWLAGFASGVALLRWADDERDGEIHAEGEGAADTPAQLTWLHRLHEPGSPMRLNDAKADAQGRLWFGTMNNLAESETHGRLYRLDTDGSLHQVDEGYAVTNGPTFSHDGRTLFHTDSVARTIYAFDVAADGNLSAKRVWKKVEGPESTEGYPDGMCTDAEDHLWVARWGAGCVTRLDPDGMEVSRLHTGAPHTTNCCFGGAGYSELYITSARVGLDDAALAAAPHSGALFVARGAGQGRAAAAWRG